MSCRQHGKRIPCLALAAAVLAAPSALAQRPYGADYSHWNGTITPAQWTTLYNSGWVFAWTKATESPYYWDTSTCAGSWYVDNTFVNNMVNARAAGILIGCYHFAHPQCYTAVAEADGFVDRAGAYISGGYLRPVLDLEDGTSLGATALSNWVNAFCNRVVARTGVEPIVYTNTNYAYYYLNSTVANRTLWIAQYLYPPFDEQTDNPDIGVWSNWAFWQYSDNGTLPGLSGSHDVNVFNGTAAGLLDYVIPGGTQPPYIVESRSGGQNYANYSETGTWGSGTSKSTAPLCTAGIGHRWCTLDSTAKTAVFRYTPPTTGTYEIFTTNTTTSNSGSPLIHKVTHAGGTSNMGVCQNTTCSPNAVNVWYSLGQYNLNANVQYSVTLDGSTTAGSGPSGNAGRSDAIKWTYVGETTCVAPTITTHPSNQSVPAGGTANFTVAASGTATLSYQWQKNSVNISNGGHYAGATTATLTISSVDSTDAATYRCVVTNSCGTATSNGATLTVTTIQTIINDAFDTYADQAAFVAAWPTPGTSLVLSTARYYSSPKSLYGANDATARSNKKTFTEVYGTNTSPVTLSVRFYDPNTVGTGNQWIELRDYAPVTQKQLIQFGVYSGTSTTKYSARVTFSPGNGWVATSVNRTAGWHELKVVIKSTTMDFYVDGVLASGSRAYAASEGAVSWEEMRLGSGYASASVYANYDSVLLTKGQ